MQCAQLCKNVLIARKQSVSRVKYVTDPAHKKRVSTKPPGQDWYCLLKLHPGSVLYSSEAEWLCWELPDAVMDERLYIDAVTIQIWSACCVSGSRFITCRWIYLPLSEELVYHFCEVNFLLQSRCPRQNHLKGVTFCWHCSTLHKLFTVLWEKVFATNHCLYAVRE